jgi:hypothetical protein
MLQKRPIPNLQGIKNPCNLRNLREKPIQKLLQNPFSKALNCPSKSE